MLIKTNKQTNKRIVCYKRDVIGHLGSNCELRGFLLIITLCHMCIRSEINEIDRDQIELWPAPRDASVVFCNVSCCLCEVDWT